MAADQKLFRMAMGRFATGVSIVTVALDGRVKGMTANAITSVSLEPLLLLVSVGRKSRTHSWLTKTARYGVSILTQSQRDISDFFAKATDDPIPSSIPIRFSARGTPIIDGCLAFLDCPVVQTVEAGDHTLFLATVDDIHLAPGEPPLLFYEGRYGRFSHSG